MSHFAGPSLGARLGSLSCNVAGQLDNPVCKDMSVAQFLSPIKHIRDTILCEEIKIHGCYLDFQYH
jgi:hypothetical protein